MENGGRLSIHDRFSEVLFERDANDEDPTGLGHAPRSGDCHQVPPWIERVTIPCHQDRKKMSLSSCGGTCREISPPKSTVFDTAESNDNVKGLERALQKFGPNL